MAGMSPTVREIIIPLGLLRHSILKDLGPAWLRFDGVTEYHRAAYPEFVAKVAQESGSAAWFLAGSSAAKFKLVKVARGTATVATGFDHDAGEMFGAETATLSIENIPEHSHAYDKAAAQTAKGGLLAGVLTLLTGITVTTGVATGLAGAKAPRPVPIQPLSFSAHLFVFAGRPRA